MFQRFCKKKKNVQFLASVMAWAMVLSTIGVWPMTVEASTGTDVSGNDLQSTDITSENNQQNSNEENAGISLLSTGGGNTYTLDTTADITPFADGTKQNGDTETAGTDGYFTLIYNTSTKVDKSAKTFADGYAGTYRLNLGGKLDMTKSAVKFTTQNAATVEIWWVQGGDDNRQMAIYDSAGNEVTATEGDAYVKNSPYMSTLELESAGTYYLGGRENNNNIYKVVVTEKVSAAPIVSTLDTTADITPFADGTKQNGDTETAGTDGYFTLIYNTSTKVDKSAKTFADGYVGTYRLNLGGKLDITKSAVKFTTQNAATVEIWWVQGGDDNRQMAIYDSAGNEVTATEGDAYVKNSPYMSTLELESAGTYYLGGRENNNNIYKVVVTEQASGIASPTVSTVNASAPNANGVVTVSFTGTAGGEGSEYVVKASKDDGANWEKVGTFDGTATSGSVDVDLHNAKRGYGTWKFLVVGENEMESSPVVYAAETYVLSGTYNTGLGTDVSLLTNLTFTATTDSIYVVPAVTLDTTAHTYSVVLEKGTKYEVAAVGVDEYSMTNPDAEIAYSADTTLNLEFEKKALYPITISLGSTPDLSGKNITYKFVHEDGAEYSFADASAIQLRDGKYTVSLGGDFDRMAYGIKTGETLTVAGAPVNHGISFKALTSWSFAEFTGTIQSTIGYFKGLTVDATNGKLRANGNSAQMNIGTKISVPVTGACTVSVTAHQADMALYTIAGTPASTTNATTTYSYTGNAGTIDIVSTDNNAYIASITLTYPVEEVQYVEQDVMPFVPENDTDGAEVADTDNIPRQNKKDSLTVQPVGQKLNLSQTGGSFAANYKDVKDVAYYIFPATADENKLEFDLLVTEAKATGNDAGFFGGVFTDTSVYTLGLRGGEKVRGIYTKGQLPNSDFAGAGSPTEESIGLNRPIHYLIEVVGGKVSVTATFVDDDGVEQSRNFSQSPKAEPDGTMPTELYYGFALSNVSATITNMVYTGSDGTVLYDQNACYYPVGTAPRANAVTATVAESREYITVSWTGTVPEDDGTYVVAMQKDGGAWTELSSDVTGMSYQYDVPAGESGNYCFRVCGQLGKETLGGSRNAYATMSGTVYVMGALAKPVVAIKASATDISISWDAINGAEYYQVYRYSYDEGEANAVCVADRLTATSYKDTSVTQEMPYYYQVKAVSDATNNSSPLSDTVWQVPTAGHSGDYVYEDEATEIFITKKSYDTVFTDKVTLEGNVYGDGTLEAVVNGTVVSSKEMSAKDAFSFELTVVSGRNDVNLLFTDKDGNVTRETYNFVYLTNYDIVVDAAYTGNDGAANENGIPTYKTVQAAVNSVPAGNTDSKVILVMAGSYEERLVVNSPYISLIGEDRENTLIHYYPGVLGAKYEAGGDMDKRCATVIASTATGFSAENISFANDYVYATPDGKTNKSADAIRVEADQSSFVNVKFIGVQDTLYMHSGKQYYYKCVIEGLIDFVYSGNDARSFFNDCEIVFVYESTKTSGYVSAPKTAANAPYGLTFYNCVITSEEGCSGTGYLLARPWEADAYITWIDCYMGKAVNELAPYNSMSGNMHEDARFFEFGTYGPGFAINVDRRQISPSKASEMVSDAYLGWSPDTVVKGISSDHYVGSIVTDKEEEFVTAERTDDKYLWSDGDDTGLKMYDMEGYSTVYGVSGGGLLKETNENYYKVATANEFLDALLASKSSGKNSVIELTADINLGCNEVENFASYSDVIKAYSAQPLTHPTLIASGVSQLTFNNVYNLTIFSMNGASIKHANITMKNSENIILRNIKFDELWEWDEATEGDYDRNDWDYMTIDSNCNGIWIDHCTFYKAYDGIVDIKNPSPIANVTISWCEFLPGSEDNVFFDVMMDDVFANPDKYATYQHMLDEGMTNDQVYMYAYGQKKTHLFGQDDSAVNAAGIHTTLANNYYKDSMDRMPRLRYGYSHVYNCIMDSQNLLDVRLSIANEDIAKKIVSNGAASTCGAQVLLENCYISGIQNALNSGNGSSPSGYINAVNSLYYMDGVATTLEPKANSSADDRVLVTDADEFVSNLPYSDYILYDAEDLNGIVKYYAGAGKLDLTVLQWEKTSYNAAWEDPDIIVEPEDELPKDEDPEEDGSVGVEPGDGDDDDDDDVVTESTTPTESTTSTTKPSAKKPSASKPVTPTAVAEKVIDFVVDEATDWSDVVDAMDNLWVGAEKTLAIINVELSNHYVVDEEVLATMQGKNATMVLDQGNGVIWEISGKDITAPAEVSLKVDLESAVGEDVQKVFEGAGEVSLLSMENEGDLGFKATMKYPAGANNNGKYVNLFRDNNGTYELVTTSKVAGGTAEFIFSQSDDYIVVISNEAMTGVPEAKAEDDKTSESSKTDEEPSKSETESSDVSVETGAPAIESDKKGGSALPFIIIGGIAVVAAGGGIGFAVLRKKKED